MPGGVAAVARDISVLVAGGMLVGGHITVLIGGCMLVMTAGRDVTVGGINAGGVY